MNLMELFVKIGADTSEFDNTVSGIGDKVKSGIGGALGTAAKVGAAGLAAASTAVVAFGKSAVNSGMQFDSAMSQVAATMGKPVSEIQNLRDFAQEMGSKTAFSATQAAEALNYMALAGYKDEEAMKMLPNVLNLAAAGNMDLAQASDMVTDAQSALGLSFEEAETMVDQMAKTSSTTNTSVSQLGDAILTIGATARGVKGGTAELSQVLGLLADNGIKGAEGGTHLRNMILSLQTPTKDGTEALEKLGMSYADMYDEAGNMRSLPEIFQQLQGAMAGMTQESKDAIISGIFNKTDLAAVNALVGTNKDRWDEVANAIANADGAAEAMANTQLDNLEGDVTLFKSALEGAQIAMSDKMTPTLREFVQLGTKGLSDMTEAFRSGGLDAAMESFGTFLSTALSQVIDTIPTIVSAAATLLTAFVKGISQNIGKVTKAAVSIVKGIVTVVVKNLPMLVSAAGEMVSSLVKGLAEELPNMIPVFIEAIQGIGDALPEGMKQYILPTFGSITAFLNDVFKGDWAAAWEEIKNIFHNAFTGAKDFIVDAFGKAKDAVMTVDWLGLGQNIVSTILSALTDFSTMMFDLFTTAADAVVQVDWGNVGTQIFTAITNALGQFVEYVTNIFTLAKDAIAKVDWAEVGHQIVDFFVSSFEAVAEGVQNIDWLALGTAILEYIKTAFDSAVDLFGAIFTDVWNYISQIDWLALGSAILDLIKTGLSTAVTTLKNIFFGSDEDDTDGVYGAIKSINWLGLGTSILDLIKEGLSAAVTALKTIFFGSDEDDTDGVFGAIKSINWKGLGESILGFIKDGLSTAVDVLKFIFLGEDEDDTDGVFGAIKSINWVGLGTAILNFIKDGLSAAVSVLKTIFFGSSEDDKDGVFGAIKSINWKGLGTKILDLIKEGLGKAVSVLKTIFFGSDEDDTDGVFGAIKSINWKDLGTKMLGLIESGFDTAKSIFKTIFQGEDGQGGVLGAIKSVDWQTLGSDIMDKIKTGVGYVKAGAGAVLTWAKDLGKEIRDGIFGESDGVNWSDLGGKLWGKIKAGVGFIGGAAWKGIGAVFNWAMELGGEIKTGIFTTNWWQVGTTMWDNLKSAFSDVKGWFEGIFDFSGIHIKLPHFTVTQWDDWGLFSVPAAWEWKWYAKGYSNPYLLNSPSVLGGYGFGDLGGTLGGEMVYSHDRLMDDIRAASGGNRNVTINVYQQPGEDSEELAERISQIMNDDYSRGQVVYG